MTLKAPLLSFIKATGAFSLARKLTGNGLHILCFHGISIKDEHTIFPQLFISREQFKLRMEWLRQHAFNIISLDEALHRLESNTLQKNSVVITFDDGWYGIQPYAIPVLKSFNFPATIYSTTYYSQKETMVFKIALRYIFEKSPLTSLNLSSIGEQFPNPIGLSQESSRKIAIQEINKQSESKMTAAERQQLLEKIASVANVDFKEMCASRMFTLLTMDEIRKISDDDMSIQLHTHRHLNADTSEEKYRQELADNRLVLKPYVQNDLVHFCYPSGVVNKNILPTLKALGIRSAVTCKPGLNYKETPPLLLSRFLDGPNISTPVFEAEMYGVLELARKIRNPSMLYK